MIKKVRGEDGSKFRTLFTGMRVRIKKTVLVEVEKPKLGEVWDKNLQRWDELCVENINVVGQFAHLTDRNGDIYLHVPTEAFEVVKD